MLKSQAQLSSRVLASVSRLGDNGHHAAPHGAPGLRPASPCQLQHGAGEERGRGKCPLQEAGDVSVGKGCTGAKPSKRSPLLSAPLSRVRKTSKESLQRADRAYLQHRQTRINIGRSQVSCPPSSVCQQGLPQPCRTRCSPQHKGRFPCLTPQTSAIPEEKASRNLSHCVTLAELGNKPPRGYSQPKTLHCRFVLPSQFR